MMLQYAAKLTPCLPEEGGYTVTFRDVPEAITDGETLEDALKYAAEALELALEHYLDERRMSPAPTPRQKGEYLIIAREPLAQVRPARRNDSPESPSGGIGQASEHQQAGGQSPHHPVPRNQSGPNRRSLPCSRQGTHHIGRLVGRGPISGAVSSRRVPHPSLFSSEGWEATPFVPPSRRRPPHRRCLQIITRPWRTIDPMESFSTCAGRNPCDPRPVECVRTTKTLGTVPVTPLASGFCGLTQAE